MKNHELNKIKKDGSISLRKFLISYYGINIEPFDLKISHDDIKYLLPDIKRISYEQANSKDIYEGNMLIVKDCYNNACIYIRPVLEIEFNMRTFYCKKRKEKIVEDLIIEEDLNTYELAKLCRAYKSANRLKEYRIVYRILKSKKGKTKKYKRENNNLIKRGIEDYD